MSPDPPVFKNHVFTRIKEQVVFENEIGRVRKDYESFLFTLLAQSAFKQEERKKKVRQIRDQLILNSSNSLSDIKLITFLVALSDSLEVNLDKEIYDNLEGLLENLKTASSFPLASKSIICWALRDVDRFSIIIDEIRNDLEKETSKALSRFRYLDAIEISFGTERDQSISKIIENPNQFYKEAAKWPRDKIAKSIIRLSQCEEFDVSHLIKLLEERVDEELSSWIEPDIWLAVVESEKVINSNIPQDDINQLLENLNKVDSSWAKVVKNINEEGVHLKLSNIIKSPSFSPIEDTFSLIALEINDREQTIQLSKSEYDVLKTFKNKKGLIPLEKREMLIYALSISYISVLIGIILNVIISSESGWTTFIEPLKLLFNGELGSLFSKSNLIFVLGGYLLWWLFNLIKVPYQEQGFNSHNYLLSIPIISRILKQFAND